MNLKFIGKKLTVPGGENLTAEHPAPPCGCSHNSNPSLHSDHFHLRLRIYLNELCTEISPTTPINFSMKKKGGPTVEWDQARNVNLEIFFIHKPSKLFQS